MPSSYWACPRSTSLSPTEATELVRDEAGLLDAHRLKRREHAAKGPRAGVIVEELLA